MPPAVPLIRVTGSLKDLSGEMVKSVAAKFLTLDQIKEMASRLDANLGDLLLIVAGENKLANTVLGELRREMGHRLSLAEPDLLAFAFIVDFPWFEKDSKTGLLGAMHHAFTAPKEEDIPLLGSIYQNRC